MKQMQKQKKYNLSKGSMTVEAAFLVPMAVFLSALLIFYAFYEHDRVWFTAAACEAALTGSRRTERGEDSETLARNCAQKRMEAQPFPVLSPQMELEVKGRTSRVSYQSAGETAFSICFPYKIEETIEQSDPVGWIRTAWIEKNLLNGSE